VPCLYGIDGIDGIIGVKRIIGMNQFQSSVVLITMYCVNYTWNYTFVYEI